ncbi:MAG: filamentous hemagglutinin N-terminal domain-containing protein, partial [Pseudomonas farsensis]|uniref:two-partner secretion domain-containing protein n=1 Tax=Pseudomonas farsensis TaxID=2745492 RepID=UPI003C7BFA3A
MDVRSPLFKHIALTLTGVLTLNPVLATAAQLAVDRGAGGNTSVGQANNGVPVVNIATPNGSGLSHNKFNDYNVGSQGLILNNSQTLTKTQLGGYVNGNANLKNGSARVILNEVTGANSTQLKGYTEVAGRSARVIVANPHGISCDGCGFINTPRVTLTTGKPVLDDGRLQRFDVDGGAIAIEGRGLNAGNVDQFDLITRSTQINAELHARELNVITGRNEVDANTLAATAKADDGREKPSLAIDSSALGGMYANTIRLVGTEKGVGVKLAGDMAASAGDIQIDANGQLNMARVAASRDINLTAQRIELGEDTYAGNKATVQASDTTVVRKSLAAGKQVEVKGGALDNAGVVEAGVKADGTLVADSRLLLGAERVTNRGQMVSHGTLDADVKTLDNNGGKLVSAGTSTLKAERLENANGQIISQKNLTITGGAVANQAGEMLAKHTLKVDGASLDNQGGTLAADNIDLALSGALDNSKGLVEATQSLTLAAGSLTNSEGRLRALSSTGSSQLQVDGLFNNNAGLVEVGNAGLKLTSASLTNQGGTLRHLGTSGFTLGLADLGQAGGRFISNGELTVDAASWTNTSELQAERLTLNIGQFTQTSSGALVSRQDIVATGGSWVNDGLIATDGALQLRLSGDYSGNGSLHSLGKLLFEAASASFGASADIRAGASAELVTTGVMSNQGSITAKDSLLAKAASLQNFGTLGSAGALRLQADALRNERGLIFSGADMALRTASLTNRLGDIYSLGALDIARDDAGSALTLVENLSGSIESRGNLDIRAARLDNRKDVFDWGLVQTAGRVDVKCYDCSGDYHNVDYIATEQFETRVLADSAASRIHSGANLTLIGGAVKNHYSTLSAGGDIRIEATTLENLGAAFATVERERTFNTGRITDGTDKRFRRAWINPYNALTEPAPMPTALERWNLVTDVQRETPLGIAAPAIIQAGGNVHIQASQPLENTAVLAHQAPQDGSGKGLDAGVGSATDTLVVRLNPQLPADTAQQAVDPLGLPGFSLPGGEHGLFQVVQNPGHNYLVETNPAFADLGRFVSSDYMLGQLGFDPDQAQRRLGDGLYEQRLIEQAVAARTGKRLLDGFKNDEEQFRYLMDNAVASKEALNLALGVGLSAEQVAALTHDIVWLEEREVNGQRVLAPVVYLAQAGDRLAPTGALMQGQNLTLIGGSSLSNSGTLRASANLDASASGILNTGLMQADQRLQLLATQSIHNAQAGVISGKDVSAVAITGDIINERSVSQQTLSGKGYAQTTSVVGKASVIEAGNDLKLQAGGDLLNVGSRLQAGGNAELKAGGDLIITSAVEEQNRLRQDKRHYWNSTQTTQHGSDVSVGGNLAASAAENLAIIASRVKAGGDVTLGAGKDITLAAAANEDSSEYRYKRSGKKVERQDSSLQQQATVIEAGGDLGVLADGNLLVMASQLKAGNEAYLYAGKQLELLAGQNTTYHLYDMKKKGSWGSKKTRRDEVTQVRAVGSQITTGGDMVLASGGDQRYQRANLQSGGGLLLDSGGAITFEAVKDLDQESHEKSKSSVVWQSSKGKGNTDETVLQSQLGARGDIIVKAVDGLSIDLKEVNQQSVSQTIDAMVQADPSMAWLKDMEQRGDVDWKRVKEVHDSFKYNNSSLGGAAAMVIAIVVAYFTAGAASGLVA